MGRQMCELCKDRRAALIRPRNRQQLCQQCFFVAFENEIHKTIVDNRLFKPGERVAIAASGGKDSTVLAHILTELNRRHNYGLDLFLLSIDEGITGYRDDSLETVKRNEIQVKSSCFVTLMKSELFFVTSNHVCMSLLNRSF
jgi:cytoplasmic tRNA 2-thiolation protein 1